MMNKNIDFLKIDNINERIKKLRSYLRLPRSYFEVKHHLSKETLKKWETGEYKLKDSSIDKIIRVFKKEGLIVSKQWLESGQGAPPIFVQNTKTSSTSSKDDFLIDTAIPEEIRTAREVEIISRFYENTVHHYVTDESMMPIYPMDCCVIGIKKYGKDEILKEVGKDCIVKIKQFDHPILRRVHLERENVFCLYIINCAESMSNIPPIIMNAEIEYVAPVKWIIR